MASPLRSGAAMVHAGNPVNHPSFGWKHSETPAADGAAAGRGNGGVLTVVAKGERDYGIIVDFMPLNAADQGSPVGYVFPDEGVTAVTGPMATLAAACSVEAARAFVNWQLSDEGQRFHVGQGCLPLRAGLVRPAAYRDVEIRVTQADPVRLPEQTEEVKRRFAELFGG